VRGSQRCSRESWITALEIKEPKFENCHGDGQKEVQVTLSWGKKRKGEKLEIKIMMMW
jgi:hypothetical protein